MNQADIHVAEDDRSARCKAYLDKRGVEIYERRTHFISHDDMALALKQLSTRTGSVLRLMAMCQRDDPAAQELRSMIQAALLTDSIDIALTEFNAMEAAPPSSERH